MSTRPSILARMCRFDSSFVNGILHSATSLVRIYLLADYLHVGPRKQLITSIE